MTDSKGNLLLVDDDVDITEILGFNLKSEGYKVNIVHSAEEALKQNLNKFDVILLDVMMGGISGYKFAEKIRSEKIQTPIIFLTAKDTENDLLTGFSVGGDDYISKPFSIKEVMARVKALMKRQRSFQKFDHPQKYQFLELLIDFQLKEVFIKSENIQLTKTEFELLTLLSKKPNEIFSRERIIEIVWRETPYITERTVDVHLTRLRKKLKDYACCIQNKQGYGYFFYADLE